MKTFKVHSFGSFSLVLRLIHDGFSIHLFHVIIFQERKQTPAPKTFKCHVPHPRQSYNLYTVSIRYIISDIQGVVTTIKTGLRQFLLFQSRWISDTESQASPNSLYLLYIQGNKFSIGKKLSCASFFSTPSNRAGNYN